ncbi:MAG: hypothetical protein ACSHWW_00605 [Nonlabens sp.]|uniref:hypothetical protein n=1 Tax=Nonlabens sp. TaxID=1888209 RepID=UPI003EF71AB6
MKKLILLISLFIAISCQQTADVTTENINSIFATKDFSISYRMGDDKESSMSFREDYMTYKSDQGTQRVELSYNDVLKINAFIAEQFPLHDATRAETPSITLYTDTKMVTLKVPQYASKLRFLINELPL